VEQEADIGIMDFSPSYLRAAVIDFSEWFSTGEILNHILHTSIVRLSIATIIPPSNFIIIDPVVMISQAPTTLQLPFLLLQIFHVYVIYFCKITIL